MIRKGDKKAFISDGDMWLCECIGVNKNGNTIVKVDYYKRSSLKKGFLNMFECDLVRSDKFIAYDFNEAQFKAFNSYNNRKRDFEVEF